MRSIFSCLLAGFLSCGSVAPAADITLRVSLENSANHMQVQMVQRFVAKVTARAGNRLHLDVITMGNLLSDSELPRALSQGRIDIGVPGIWQLDRFVPDVQLFFLPDLYGRDAADSEALVDGAVGKTIDAELEQRLRVKVFGPWIDLGYAHLFTTGKPVQRIEDLTGLTIRVAGSQANSRRLIAFGAKPVLTPWPDLRSALEKRAIDGLITTFETAASGQLWQVGIRFAYEDQQYFARYVPLIALSAWQRLPIDLRALMTDSWAQIAPEARQAARLAQANARLQLQRHGVVIHAPSSIERAANRQFLIAREDAIAAGMGLTPAIIEHVRAVLRERDDRR